jgi:putative FmdB family regulatory protein
MPCYCYVCDNCGARDMKLKRMSESATRETCPCGQAMRRDMTAELVGSPNMEWTPIVSEAIGVHPKQVTEHRRRHPDIPITDDGRVVINSLSEQKRILRKLGFMDRKGFC